MTTTAALAPLDAFSAHEDPINHVVFAREAGLMATGDTAMCIKVWRNRDLIRTFDMHSISDKVRPTERIRGIRFSNQADSLLIAAGEFVISHKLATSYDEPEWVYAAPRLFGFLIVSPTSLAVSNGDMVAASFDNGTIATWDPNGTRRSLVRHNAVPRTMTFLPDETLIGTDGFSVSLWERGQRKPLWHRQSRERIYGMAASSDGKYVAIRRLFTTTVYDIASGEAVVEHKQGRGLPLLAFAPNSHVLAVGTQHEISLYEVGGEQRAKLALDDAELISLGFQHDGSKAVAGCSDGQVRTWDNPIQARS